MSFLIKEYDIPFIGKIELIEATRTERTFYGNYYAKNCSLRTFVTNCSSLEELINKTAEEIKRCMKQQKQDSEEAMEREKKKIAALESSLKELQSSEADFLRKYQTDNPLQLEHQRQNSEQRG